MEAYIHCRIVVTGMEIDKLLQTQVMHTPSVLSSIPQKRKQTYGPSTSGVYDGHIVKHL